MEEEQLSLANLREGGAIEMFDEELRAVLENVMDPNTAAKASRSITLTVKIKPDETRSFADIEIACKSSMAPAASLPSKITMGKSKGQVAAYELLQTQKGLFAGEEDESKGQLHQIKGGRNDQGSD